jgi:hypothetical protein
MASFLVLLDMAIVPDKVALRCMMEIHIGVKRRLNNSTSRVAGCGAKARGLRKDPIRATME